MATNVKLLRHQSLILQAPYVHQEAKFHFDVAGQAIWCWKVFWACLCPYVYGRQTSGQKGR